MNEETQSVGDTNPVDSVNEADATATNTKDSVAYSTYQRTVSEAKKAKEQLRELNERLASIEATNKKQEESKMLEEKKYQELLSLREKELEDVSNRFSKLESERIIETKARHFLSQVGGLINDEYLQFVDFDQIIYDPETGKVDDLSLAKEAERFSQKHHMLIAKKESQKVPVSSPQGSVSTGDSKADVLSKIAKSGMF